MSTSINDLQILNAIVCAFAVFMVDVFIWMEFASKMFLHDDTVNLDALSTDPLNQVSVGIKAWLSAPRKDFGWITIFAPAEIMHSA